MSLLGFAAGLIIRNSGAATPSLLDTSTRTRLQSTDSVAAPSIEALAKDRPSSPAVTPESPPELGTIDSLSSDSVPTTGSSNGEASTSEWSGLPRSKWDFIRRIVTSPESIRADDLFRHVQLNPGDTPIALADRQILAGFISGFQNEFTSSNLRVGATRAAELEEMKEAGLTTIMKVTHGTTPSGQPVMDLPRFSEPSSFSMQFGGDSTASIAVAPLRSMPRTSREFEYHDYLVVELGGGVINFFQSLGACPKSLAEELLRKLADPKNRRAPH
ncbi:MAG: hypothetical protein U1F36_17320 [Planctomycetota bacterium]